MRRKRIGAALVALFTLTALGAAAADNGAAPAAAAEQYRQMAAAIQKDPQQLKWTAEGLTSQEVVSRFKHLQEILLRGNDGKSISLGALNFEMNELKRMQSYPFFEADTRIDTAWLNNAVNTAVMLLKVRREKLQTMFNNNRTQTPEFKQLYAEYIRRYKAFCTYTSQPVPSKNQQRMLQQMKLKKMLLPLLDLPTKANAADTAATQGAGAADDAEKGYQSGLSGRSGSGRSGSGSSSTRQRRR